MSAEKRNCRDVVGQIAAEKWFENVLEIEIAFTSTHLKLPKQCLQIDSLIHIDPLEVAILKMIENINTLAWNWFEN